MKMPSVDLCVHAYLRISVCMCVFVYMCVW